jgi:hypothetical protein
MDSAMPHVEAAPGSAENDANGVAAFAPPSTIALAAANDYGATLVESIDLYRKDPAMAEALEGVEQAAGILGGLEESIGWMGDTGLVIAESGESLEGGIVSIPADEAGGRKLLTTLRSFATLGGQYGISVSEEQYAGTTITTVDLGSANDLAAMAGQLGGVPVPDEVTSDLPGVNVEIAYAAPDGLIVIGSGPDFVKHVLDAGAGQSLADDARYAGLVDRVGAEHTAVSFVDITAVRGLVEEYLVGEATPAEQAEYEESIKPFLTPFDAFAAASVVGGDVDQQHAIVTVK